MAREEGQAGNLIKSTREADEETGEALYWSNEFGWVDRESATIFTEAEREESDLPIGGEWETL